MTFLHLYRMGFPVAEKIERGQLAVGTCEIVMLNRDSSQPRRTIARQTARCACRRGQIAGTTRARPACVDVTGAIHGESLPQPESDVLWPERAGVSCRELRLPRDSIAAY
ncbi:hypothetical protein SKAU_G00113210 [Synaphobranchus kaupii]|uniref:Protein FAM19A5 n=1 Tax=Synaphobranchus kaupii TaxID=118154 RepID=A0A9Q1G1M7_SYNKA|nr:hypothetical protein SKAU_G00113210 [Synaphobranchus kaupii]